MGAVLHVRAFEDNYIWLIRPHDAAREVVIVDPGDAAPVNEYIDKHGLAPVAILCTHHHWDHSDGIPELCTRYDIPAYGPAREPVAGLTHLVTEGDEVALPHFSYRFRVLDIPGHTAGHIAFVGDGQLFCGDTLFSAGCGRLFEGTAAQLHESLKKLAELPDATEVYCGHEYTLANLRFAQAAEPENRQAHDAHAARAQARLAQNLPSLPSTIAIERQVNPFLRLHEPKLRARLLSGLDRKSDPEVALFAKLRRWKDDFKG